MKIVQFVLTVSVMMLVVFEISHVIIRDVKYDNVDIQCDMKGVLNKTNITKKNLIACNYYEN